MRMCQNLWYVVKIFWYFEGKKIVLPTDLLEKWKVGVGDKHIFKGGQIKIKELYM